MLRIAIVEDDEDNKNQILGFICQYEKVHGKEIEIFTFSNSKEILMDYRPEYDIILMDIEMPEINGMEAAEQIRKSDSDVVIVFITNMAHYAILGYSVGALDFILKPVNYYTFSTRLTRAIDRTKKHKSREVLLTLHDRIVRINTNQIYYVEIQNRMLSYFTEQGEYVLRNTMQNAEAELKNYHFVRCNHWYLVNLRHVAEIRKDIAVVAGNKLEISRRNKAPFLTALTRYVGGGF